MNKTELLTLAEENVKPKPVPLKEAFWFWMKLGFISFGGPAGQIAIMHQELVENRRWISESVFSTHSISVWCCPVRKLSNLPPTLAG